MLLSFIIIVVSIIITVLTIIAIIIPIIFCIVVVIIIIILLFIIIIILITINNINHPRHHHYYSHYFLTVIFSSLLWYLNLKIIFWRKTYSYYKEKFLFLSISYYDYHIFLRVCCYSHTPLQTYSQKSSSSQRILHPTINTGFCTEMSLPKERKSVLHN